MRTLPVGTVVEFEHLGLFAYSQIVVTQPSAPWLWNFSGPQSDRLGTVEIASILKVPGDLSRLALVTINAGIGTTEGVAAVGTFPVPVGLTKEPTTRMPRPGSRRAGRPEWFVEDPDQARPRVVAEPLPPEVLALPISRFWSVEEYLELLFDLGEGALIDRDRVPTVARKSGAQGPYFDIVVELPTAVALDQFVQLVTDERASRLPGVELTPLPSESSVQLRLEGMADDSAREAVEAAVVVIARDHGGTVTGTGFHF